MTRRVLVRDVPIGGGAPIVVQSMTNTDTADVEATVEQIGRLERAGCDNLTDAFLKRSGHSPDGGAA